MGINGDGPASGSFLLAAVVCRSGASSVSDSWLGLIHHPRLVDGCAQESGLRRVRRPVLIPVPPIPMPISGAFMCSCPGWTVRFRARFNYRITSCNFVNLLGLRYGPAPFSLWC